MYEDLITILPSPVFRVPSPTNQNSILVERKPITIIIIFAFVRPIRIHSWFSENQSLHHHHHLGLCPTNQNLILVERKPITIIIIFAFVRPIRIQSLLSEKRSPSSSSLLVSDQSESALGLARTNHLLHLHCHDSVSCSTNQKPIFVE